MFSYLAALRSHAPGEISPQSQDECCLGGEGEFVVLGMTSKRLLWHGFHFAMVCHTVDLLRFSATTPAYHAVSPTVAAIFISRLCVLLERVPCEIVCVRWGRARQNDVKIQTRIGLL